MYSYRVYRNMYDPLWKEGKEGQKKKKNGKISYKHAFYVTSFQIYPSLFKPLQIAQRS